MLLRAYRQWPLPSLPFLLGIWPRGQGYLCQLYRWPHRSFNSCGGMSFGRPCHGRNLRRLHRWAGLRPVQPAALSRLASRAFSARHQNSYHNCHHIMQVMLLAALFSYRAGCSVRDRQMLILAALAHDLGHQGVRASVDPAIDEAASARIAARLFFRRGAQGPANRQLTALIMATASVNAAPISAKATASPHRQERLAALLRDADLFASHNYGWQMQLWLAAKVKFERRSVQPVDTILSDFLAATCLQSCVGLDLAAGKWLR